jgi:predicted N-formylglutamate amidohydrolase
MARGAMVLRPNSESKIVLTCEHGSSALPRGLQLSPSQRTLLKTHWASDLGAWELTRLLSQALSFTAIGGRYSRLVADLNRNPDESTFSRSRAGKVDVGFNQNLTRAVIQSRVTLYHAPYHDEIDRQILRRVRSGIRPFLLSIHSFTPEMEGKQRPFQAGVLYSAHRNLARRFSRLIRRENMTCVLNRPYSGLKGFVYSVERHGRKYGIPYLELEINQSILGSSRSQARVAASLESAIRDLMKGLR